MYKRYNNDGIPTWLIIVLFCCVLALGGGCQACNKAGTQYTVIGKVTDKAVKVDDNKSRYLIFVETVEGNEVLEVTDSLLKGRFDSSDMYAIIKVGTRYEFTVAGERNHLLSWYPNIYEAKEIDY